MKLVKGKGIKILSGFFVMIMTILTAFLVYTLLVGDLATLHRFFNVGNVWIRLLGVFIGVQVVLLFVILIVGTYRVASTEARFSLCGALAGNTLVILILFALIYSGTARLDAEFTIDTSVKHTDVSDKLTEGRDIVSEDNNTSINEARVVVMAAEEMMSFYFFMENKTDLTVDEVRYSIMDPDGKIYSGVAVLDKEALEEISGEGTHVGVFDVFLPLKKGNYITEILVDYIDNQGERHTLSYEKEKQID